MLDIGSKDFECTSSSHCSHHSVGNNGVFYSRLTLLELGMPWTLNPKGRPSLMAQTCAMLKPPLLWVHSQLICSYQNYQDYALAEAELQLTTFKGPTAWVCEMKVLTFLLAVSYSEITPKSSFPFSYKIIITTCSTQLVHG